MPVTFRYASFPLARREGPSNLAESSPLVPLTDVEGIISAQNNSRASIIIRNTSPTFKLYVYFNTGAGIDGMNIEPNESITLDNIKNTIYGIYEADGSGNVRVIQTLT